MEFFGILLPLFGAVSFCHSGKGRRNTHNGGAAAEIDPRQCQRQQEQEQACDFAGQRMQRKELFGVDQALDMAVDFDAPNGADPNPQPYRYMDRRQNFQQ